jgi:pimeloyl-ACP methyl ester carboxylesterase
MVLQPSDNYHLNIFSDVPESEAKSNMSIFIPHSCASWMGKLTYPAYKYIPTTYVIPTDDRIIPTEYQNSMLAAAQKDGAEGINVVSLETGHAPMLTAPEAVAKIFIGVAKGV